MAQGTEWEMTSGNEKGRETEEKKLFRGPTNEIGVELTHAAD